MRHHKGFYGGGGTLRPIGGRAAVNRPISAATPKEYSRQAPIASSISSTICSIHSMQPSLGSPARARRESGHTLASVPGPA